jgi:hypothetical protein
MVNTDFIINLCHLSSFGVSKGYQRLRCCLKFVAPEMSPARASRMTAPAPQRMAYFFRGIMIWLSNISKAISQSAS